MLVESIISNGLAVGAVYALIGIAYNVMFAASRVFSFTAGSVGMLGGVFGAIFISKMGMPVAVGFVLSTLAAALMIQQLTAIYFSTDAVPFPRVIPIESGIVDQKFWLPVLACGLTILGLEYLFRHTLIGRAFLAIAEDTYAARALGLPEVGLRMASFALAGMISVVAGFAAGQLLFASLANGPLLNFYGFVPVALGGMGSNRGAVIGGLALGLFQQTANYFFGGIFSSVAVFIVFIVVLLVRPEGLAGAATARRV
jgi:branched-chain amino acid transport system permease protein